MQEQEMLIRQIKILARLLSNSKVAFNTAHYIVFSDYTTESHLIYLLENVRMNSDIKSVIAKEYCNLIRERLGV